MKNSIKMGVFTLAFFSLFSKNSNAQSTPTAENHGSSIRLSIGVEAGLPVGNLKNGYNWSFGGSVQADFPIVDDNLYVTINGGYNNIFAKNNTNSNDLHLIPVKAGLKYFPIKVLYLQGEAGASFLTNSNTYKAGKSAAFVYAPQVGVLVPVGRRNYIDAGFRFEGNSKFFKSGQSNNFLGLRVAYAFNL